MSTPDLDEVRKKAEFDRLMNLAQINRRRGEYQQAGQMVKQALELNPADPDAREFAADLLAAAGNLAKAQAVYKELVEEDHSRASAEEKYAKVTLQIAEAQRQKDLLQNLLEHPEKSQLPPRSPAVAAIFSGIPGLGHMYCGEYVKGVVLFLASALSWLIFFAFSPNLSYVPAEQKITRFVQDMSPIAVLFLVLAIVVQLYAIVNAAVVAEKTGKADGIDWTSGP